jgi:hypothetical protein
MAVDLQASTCTQLSATWQRGAAHVARDKEVISFGLARARCARFVFKCLIGCGSAWMHNNAPRHPNCDDAKRE